MRISGLFVVALLLADCRADTAPPREEAPGAPAAAARSPEGGTAAQTSPGAERTVAEHRIGLLVEGDGCWLTHRAGGSDPERLRLDLRPPCHLLTWQAPPPRGTSAEGESDGLPIGDVGDPIAWKYPGAGGVIAVAVIGDPVTGDMRSGEIFKSRERQGYRCASSMQGALLLGTKARLSKKRDHVGVLCVELGAEEKDFWILAHE